MVPIINIIIIVVNKEEMKITSSSSLHKNNALWWWWRCVAFPLLEWNTARCIFAGKSLELEKDNKTQETKITVANRPGSAI